MSQWFHGLPAKRLRRLSAPRIKPPPGGHRHPQLDQSAKSRFNSAQVASGIGRDSALSRKVLVPAERVGAAEAKILQSQGAPH